MIHMIWKALAFSTRTTFLFIAWVSDLVGRILVILVNPSINL